LLLLLLLLLLGGLGHLLQQLFLPAHLLHLLLHHLPQCLRLRGQLQSQERRRRAQGVARALSSCYGPRCCRCHRVCTSSAPAEARDSTSLSGAGQAERDVLLRQGCRQGHMALALCRRLHGGRRAAAGQQGGLQAGCRDPVGPLACALD
jgi:hypothetical protein